MSEMNKIPNDYNYPSLNREDLIMNRCLDSTDFRLRKFKQLDTKRDWSVNNYSLDIPGAAPRHIGFYSQKSSLFNSNLDIPGSTPKKLYIKTNKPNYSLSNQDIEKSSPKLNNKFNTNRHINPLEPDYSLPSAQDKYEPYEPKFVRDNINVNDIQGAQPKKYYLNKMRDNISLYCDTSPSKIKKYLAFRPSYDYMDFRDVYKKNKITRGTNPLEPVYTVGHRGGVKYTYGEIEKSKPAVLLKYKSDTNYHLTTADIDGAQPDTKSLYTRFKIINKRPMKYLAEDIIGAHADTKPKGLRSSRHINPIEPEYELPGWKEQKENENRRYNTVWNEMNENQLQRAKSEIREKKEDFSLDRSNNIKIVEGKEEQKNEIQKSQNANIKGNQEIPEFLNNYPCIEEE